MLRLESANEVHNRPLRDLVKLLAEQATTLARQEIELAKAEMLQKKAEAKPAIMALVVAAVLGVICLCALTVLAITGLDAAGLPTWASALLIAVIAGLIALVLALSSKRKLQALSPVPEETMTTLKEDLRWAKLQRTSIGR
jgi:Flp pilus assembly protein TadB